jgi:hypothetical protein
MNGRVGQLRCRYHVVGPQDSAPPASARLDRLARTRLPAALADPLDNYLRDDPTVYVLRRAESRVLLSGGETDVHMARAWAASIAGAVLNAIADNAHDGTDIVRFNDDAEYIGSFVADLLHGRAWERWFYGQFSPLQSQGTVGTLRAVLGENRDRVPAILQVIHRLGVLDRLLRVADDATLGLLWRDAPEGGADDNSETARPLFLAVVRLLDRLGWWVEPRPDAESLWHALLATQPLPTSWRDRRDLTATFVSILQLLVGRGDVHRHVIAGSEALSKRLDLALDDLDWLEPETVRSAVTQLLRTPIQANLDLPLRPTEPSPLQQELLADLAHLLAAGEVWLDPDRLDTTGNALRLHTALAAQSPRWRDDPLAKRLIERLLVAARLMTAWDRKAPPGRHLPAELGIQGAAVVAAIAARVAAPYAPDAQRIDTECAGVFLLIRAVWDVHLPALVQEVGYPPIAAVLAALGLRWSGEAGVTRGRIDPGLALLGGLDSVKALGRLWQETAPESHRKWQKSVRSSTAVDHPDAHELAALNDGQLGRPEADAALGFAAIALLRVWARWLRGFSSSSMPFLLERFVRRSGLVIKADNDLLVMFHRRPLDVVLDIAGYTDTVDLTPLWGSGQLRFEVLET